MNQLITRPAHARIFAVFAVMTLVLGFFALGSTSAQASSRECHSGDLNDCQAYEMFEDSDEEQGVASWTQYTSQRAPIAERSPAIRCHLTQSKSEECQRYFSAATFAENVFAEGSEYDDSLPAAFVNGRGGETLCWVGNRGMPCSKLIAQRANESNQQNATLFSDEESEYAEQGISPTPIGGCPLVPSTPCYQFRSR